MLLTISFFLLVCVAAQYNSQGRFLNPPPTGAIHDYSQNPVYHIGDFLDIEWNCTWNTINLVLWQNGNPDFEYLLVEVPNPGGLAQWQVKTEHNYTAQTDQNGTVFFLQLSIPGQKTAFGSHYFNISGPLAATSSNSTTASTPSPTVSLNPSSSSNAQAGMTNTGLAAGLGIGIGIGVAAVLGVAAFILYRRHRRNSKQQTAVVMPGYGPDVGPAGYFAHQQAQQQQQQQQQNMAPVEISEQRPSIEFFHGAERVHEVSQDHYQERGVRRVSGVFEMPERFSAEARRSTRGIGEDEEEEIGGPAGMIGLEGSIAEAVEHLSPRGTKVMSTATVTSISSSSTATTAIHDSPPRAAVISPNTRPGPKMVVRELNPGRWSQYMPMAGT